MIMFVRSFIHSVSQWTWTAATQSMDLDSCYMHRSMLCHNILYIIINKEIKYTYLENNQVISIYLKDAFYNV